MFENFPVLLCFGRTQYEREVGEVGVMVVADVWVGRSRERRESRVDFLKLPIMEMKME